AGGMLTMQVQPSSLRYRDLAVVNRFLAEALDAVKHVPGVTAAELTSQLPLSGDREEYGVMFEGSPQGYSSYRYGVTPGYIETMRIPLRAGRTLQAADQAGAPLVVLISEGFARRTFQ